jgi:hypothetical protein
MTGLYDTVIHWVREHPHAMLWASVAAVVLAVVF